MNQEQHHLNQALRLTIGELTNKLADETTTKNLLAIQLSQAEETNQMLASQNADLQAEITELKSLLDEQTTPEIIEGE